MTYTRLELDQNRRGIPLVCVEMRDWRITRKLSQRDFAKLLGWTGSMLGNFEIGWRDPNDRHIAHFRAFCESWRTNLEVRAQVTRLIEERSARYASAALARIVARKKQEAARAAYRKIPPP